MFIKKSFVLISLLFILPIDECSSQNQFTYLPNYHVKQAQLAKSGLTHIFWEYVDSANLSSLGVSSDCIESLSLVKQSLEQGIEWSAKIMDASGRAPVNLVGNGYLDTGNYDQCLSLSWIGPSDSPEIGQYCLLSMLPNLKFGDYKENIFVRGKFIRLVNDLVIKIGLCLPSSCSMKETQILTSEALERYEWKLIKIDNCQIRKRFMEKLDAAPTSQKISFFMLIFSVSLVIFATFADLIVQKIGIKSDLQRNVIFNFSMIKNFQNLIEPNLGHRQIPYLIWCLVRIYCVVLALHIAVWPFSTNSFTLYATSLGTINILPIAQNFGEWFTGFVFLYGGGTRSLALWRNIGPETSFFKTIKLFIKKELGISLILGHLVMTQNLVPLLSDGPLASIVTRYGIGSCAENILYYLTLQQNSLPNFETREFCLPHTWSICAEFQLIPISIVLIHVYKKWPRLGLTMNIGLFFGGFLYVGVKFYNHNLEPFGLMNLPKIEDTEAWFYHLYLPSMMNLWLYSLILLVLYLLSNLDENSSFFQMVIKNITLKLWITVILLTLWPVIWRTLFMKHKTRLLVAIYAVSYRILSGFLFSFMILRKRHLFKSFINPLFDSNDNIRKSTKHEFNNNSEQKTSSVTSDDKKSKKLKTQSSRDFYENNHKLLRITSTILTSTYLIHGTVMTWHQSQMRKPLTTLSEWFIDYIWLMILSLFWGFVYYLFFLGPISSTLVGRTKQIKLNVK